MDENATTPPADGDTYHRLRNDVVDTLREIMDYGTFSEDSVYGQAILDAADEIERLRAIITRQGIQLMIAHSETAGMYEPNDD